MSSSKTQEKGDEDDAATTSDTPNAASSNVELNAELKRALMQALLNDGRQNNPATSQRQGRKESYAFWGSQPVTQFNDQDGVEDGPIDAPKTVHDVRQEPFNLPSEFEWCICDVQNDEVAEEVKHTFYLISLTYTSPRCTNYSS